MPTLEEVQALVAKGYEVCITEPFVAGHRTRQNYSASWSILPPPGNVLVRNLGRMFALQADGDKVFDGTQETLLQLGGTTQTIRLGRTLTQVFKIHPLQRISEGTIPVGRLGGCEVVCWGWHVPPTTLQSPSGIASASFVHDIEPQPIPELLFAELKRYGFIEGELSR